jgi:hypothetical protein
MTSSVHTSADPGIEVGSTILPLASCGFARHANIARVCDTPRCDPARHEHPMQAFAMARRGRHRLGVMSHLVSFTGARRLLTSSSPDGANRRRSMPESSLTEEAAITTGGNVLAARPDMHSSMALLVERNRSAPIDGDQRISLSPSSSRLPTYSEPEPADGRGSIPPFRWVLSRHTRMSISKAVLHDHASRLLSPEG